MKIAQYINGRSWGTVGPETLDRGLGGRETAAIQLAEQWGRLGHEVTTFAYCDAPTRHHFPSGGHAYYVDHDLAAAMMVNFDWDVVLSWEEPGLFGIQGIEHIPLKLCGMQVAHLSSGDFSITGLPDAYVALSPWAKEFLARQLPEGQRIEIQPNCVDIRNYPRLDFQRKVKMGANRKAPQFFYASSPDRGLVHVLRNWDIVRRIWSDATLHVVYGAREWAEQLKWAHNLSGEMAVDILIGLDQDGIVDHGKVGQKEVAELHKICDGLMYPCDPTGPTETGCITVMEAMAAGNVPFITNADCLRGEFGHAAPMVSLPFDSGQYFGMVHQVMNDEEEYRRYQKIGREFIEESRTWDKVAAKWIEMMQSLTTEVRAVTA